MLEKATPEVEMARNVGELAEDDVRVGGHWLYVRKCTTSKEADGIVLTDKHSDDSLWCEVIGVGWRVGEKCSKAHAQYYKDVRGGDRPRRLAYKYKQGDRVLCSNDHSTCVKFSPLFTKVRPFEFFMEESWPLAVQVA